MSSFQHKTGRKDRQRYPHFEVLLGAFSPLPNNQKHIASKPKNAIELCHKGSQTKDRPTMRLLCRPTTRRKKRKVANADKWVAEEKQKPEPLEPPAPPIPGVVVADMSPTADIKQRCWDVDQEIRARQEEFGLDLYYILEEYEKSELPMEPDTALASFHKQWLAVKEEIETYTELQQIQQQLGDSSDNNNNNAKSSSSSKKKKKWRGRGRGKVGREPSHGDNAIFATWLRQRKRLFGVQCFDTAFEVLGTSAAASTSFGETAVSTSSPQERVVSGLVQEAVQDVLLLERLKESFVREAEEIATQEQGGEDVPTFCGMVCCY
ncbi:expressed unknown protein [Seminavis robusta]|uniref:Uncharacterized protein n=1 Tax=Seminavis robusta TaxID=568900 RepID=A0A9N8H7X3_9STRA|nr:expressed unknown protein [Seminavis robusta]|eukprot:Sro217_g089830.1 n/a (321) ;mRNA; r:66729-67691